MDGWCGGGTPCFPSVHVHGSRHQGCAEFLCQTPSAGDGQETRRGTSGERQGAQRTSPGCLEGGRCSGMQWLQRWAGSPAREAGSPPSNSVVAPPPDCSQSQSTKKKEKAGKRPSLGTHPTAKANTGHLAWPAQPASPRAFSPSPLGGSAKGGAVCARTRRLRLLLPPATMSRIGTSTVWDSSSIGA